MLLLIRLKRFRHVTQMHLVRQTYSRLPNGHSPPTNSRCRRGMPSGPARRPRTVASREVANCSLLTLTKGPAVTPTVLKTPPPSYLIFSFTPLPLSHTTPSSPH